jgi:putative two-component system response regulator
MTVQKSLLIVDDSPENIDILKSILKPHYALKVATNGRLALQIAASSNPPDLILLDVLMPDMDGYEVCRLLKADPLTRDIPVIFVTARADAQDEVKGFALGGVDYIIKPVSAPIVLARVATHLALNDRSRLLEELVKQRTAMLESRTLELQETRLQILQRLGRAGEYRDNETGMHVLRLSHYVGVLGRNVGLSEAEVEQIGYAALMHDIGKIGVPDHILLKPGKLTTEEFSVVMQHCQIGADIIGFHESSLLQLCRTVALTHHERWDGKGYPNHIRETDIPLAGRMTAIADIFDALISARPYKQPWSMDQALELIAKEAGHALDPMLAGSFVVMRPELEQIARQYPDFPLH